MNQKYNGQNPSYFGNWGIEIATRNKALCQIMAAHISHSSLEVASVSLGGQVK